MPLFTSGTPSLEKVQGGGSGEVRPAGGVVVCRAPPPLYYLLQPAAQSSPFSQPHGRATLAPASSSSLASSCSNAEGAQRGSDRASASLTIQTTRGTIHPSGHLAASAEDPEDLEGALDSGCRLPHVCSCFLPLTHHQGKLQGSAPCWPELLYCCRSCAAPGKETRCPLVLGLMAGCQ